ncbi:MarR family transcriptional regulator [Rothia sp. AR01]|uniref:MarR family transcriptional regulator n=1 Tax=Rothia santali TaxID=2949643 RepID=A0A9X2KHI3_9MICC|nr:MarR family transcriptional regulator [Rothia santali]MCP3425857.1 MarR family transcriptional regulator [Rothia santali]
MDDAAPEDPLALESQICFALSLASRSIVAAYRPVLEPLRLTHPQYLVMLALWERDPLSLKELSRKLGMTPGTVSPLVKRLETLGYVRRERHRDDERSLAILLTDAGRGLRRRAESIPGTMMERLGMDVEELTTLHASMLKLIAAARASGDLPG